MSADGQYSMRDQVCFAEKASYSITFLAEGLELANSPLSTLLRGEKLLNQRVLAQKV